MSTATKDAADPWKALELRMQAIRAEFGAEEVTLGFRDGGGIIPSGWHAYVETNSEDRRASGLHGTPEAALDAAVRLAAEIRDLDREDDAHSG